MEDLEQISVKTRLSFFLLFKVTPGNEHVIPAISPKPRESNTHAKSEAVSERERERGGDGGGNQSRVKEEWLCSRRGGGDPSEM